MDRKQISLAAAALLLIIGVYIVRLWRPEHQVRLHTTHLLNAVEARKWEDVKSLVADNYSDRWKHDKEFVIRESSEVFRQFIFLGIQEEAPSSSVTGSTGTTTTRIKLTGNGSSVAQMVIDRVNSLHQPFTFTWVRQSWKPWDWKLASFDQPELEIPASVDF